MKYTRALLIVLFLAAASQLSAGCLSVYNNSLLDCDAYYCPNGFFTCTGCYGDALAGYYSCIGRQAVT
jgi:hypothetical protein